MESAGEKKKFWGTNRVWRYCRSHMWCSFAMAILVAIVLLMGIMWVYMKKQYYTHLVETTYTTEEALMYKHAESDGDIYKSWIRTFC